MACVAYVLLICYDWRISREISPLFLHVRHYIANPIITASKRAYRTGFRLQPLSHAAHSRHRVFNSAGLPTTFRRAAVLPDRPGTRRVHRPSTRPLNGPDRNELRQIDGSGYGPVDFNCKVELVGLARAAAATLGRFARLSP